MYHGLTKEDLTQDTTEIRPRIRITDSIQAAEAASNT